MADDRWVSSDNGLNLRDKPGGNLIATLDNGTHLTAIGSPTAPDANGTIFQQVQTDSGQIGFVAAVFQGMTLLSTTAPASTVAVHDIWVLSDIGLILRDMPAGSFIAGLIKGTHLMTIGAESAVDANHRSWQQVRTDDNRTGWVAASIDGTPMLTTTDPNASTTTTTTTTTTTITTTTSTSTTDVWVNSDLGLNLRDAPGGNLIATLDNGSHLIALGSPNPPDANGNVWQQVRTDDNRTGWVASVIQGVATLTTTKPVVPVSVVTWGKCLAGLGMAALRPFDGADRSVIQKSKIEAFKIFTLGDANETKSLITDLRNIRSDMFIVARLFFSTSPGNHFTAQEFIDFCRNGLDACYQMGIRYFEVHNEPNLPNEGFGGNWSNGAGFNTWLIQVLNKLKGDPKYSEAKWGYPGLSPQSGNPFDTNSFLDGSMTAAGMCDWIGVHCYWQTVNEPNHPMTGSEDGMYWQHYRSRFPNKLLMITEFSNNVEKIGAMPVTSTDKGNQYAQYYQLLRHENNLGAAFAFALNWPGQDTHHEGWVFNNGETAISSTVGGKIGQPGFLA